jgi:predicted dehydrogenase
MRTIHFAIVGCGRIAQHYRPIFLNRLLNGVRLVAVCDKNDEAVLSFARDLDVATYADVHDMMGMHPELDAVLILTEVGGHAPMALALAPYKKHVVVEKPIALTLSDADQMIAAAEREGIELFVVMQNRYNRPVQALRRAFLEKRFGKIYAGTSRVRWCRPDDYYRQHSLRGSWKTGGVLANQAVHHIDLLNWFLGKPVSVFARAASVHPGIEVEDIGIAVIQYENGGVGVLEATTAAKPRDLEASLSLLGERGTVEIGGFAVNQIVHWYFEDGLENDLFSLSEFPPTVYGFGHPRYLQNVADTIRNGVHTSEASEARSTLELILAMYESIEARREIPIPFASKLCRLGT